MKVSDRIKIQGVPYDEAISFVETIPDEYCSDCGTKLEVAVIRNPTGIEGKYSHKTGAKRFFAILKCPENNFVNTHSKFGICRATTEQETATWLC